MHTAETSDLVDQCHKSRCLECYKLNEARPVFMIGHHTYLLFASVCNGCPMSLCLVPHMLCTTSLFIERVILSDVHSASFGNTLGRVGHSLVMTTRAYC
jgi:hypothetical protein